MTERKKTTFRDSVLDTYFVAIACFLSGISLIAIALLSSGAFTPFNVGLAAIVTLVVCAWFLRKRSFIARLTWQEWGVLVVLVIAIGFRSNPATYLNGGQDPGVYSSMAIHFARTGSLALSDTLLPELSDDENVRAYYLKRSMHRLREKSPHKWIGNMLPGVYLSNLEKNQWDFQFYALHPSWLAIGNWLFGVQCQSWILVFFSTLSVLSCYLIARKITGAHMPGLCAAFLLAINPGHAYLATFPVSETIAGFFFLAALYLLLDKKFLCFLLPLTALFLTRITGFLTAPLLLLSLGWIAMRRRDVRPVWAGFGVLGAYAISFYWGLSFSPHYSFDIYKSKLGLGRHTLHYADAVFVVLGALWAITGYLATRESKRMRQVTFWVARHRYVISGSLVLALLGFCAYRGYLLAFTDHYQNHGWYSKRWKMAGDGWLSIGYLSINTLRLLLSSTGLIAFLAGLIIVGGMACRRAMMAPVAILAAGFSCVFLVGQLTTPMVYYFARYLLSELVPLAIICAVIGIDSLRRALPRWSTFVFPLYAVCVICSVWPALIGRMSATEGEGLSRAVQCIDKVTGPNSVLLIDRQGLALGAYAYSTPLRLGFGKRTYTVFYKDFAAEPEKLDALINVFRQKNLDVFLLSSQTQWDGRSNLKNVLTISITQERLSARRRLPTRFSTRSRTVRLYAQRGIDTVPLICDQAAK